MHTVAVVALPMSIAFDLTTAVEVFGRVVLPSGEPGYRVLVCGTEPVVSAGPMRIATDHGIDEVDGADTIVVPGRNDVSVGTPDEVLRALKSAYADGTRIASICSGAFTLAEAGLLDGKRATTHWLAADLFRATYPDGGSRSRRSLCRRGSGADIGGCVGRLGPVPAHGRPGLRRRRRRRCRPTRRRTAAPQRGTGTVHSAKHGSRQAHCRTHRTRRCAGMDRAGGASRPDPARYRRAGRHERPHAEPPIPGRDGPDADAMGDGSARPTCSAAAGEYGARCRKDRP